MNCDQHYVVVATKPGAPGAYASCVDEPDWLVDWVVERLHEGATIQRVTCNRGHAMLQTYIAWCDEQDKHKAVMADVRKSVAKNRAKALAKPLPRNECPGCFSAIYDGAAEQGWCTNCYPRRDSYSSAAVESPK